MGGGEILEGKCYDSPCAIKQHRLTSQSTDPDSCPVPMDHTHKILTLTNF